jgi:non-specific serine/threonine protein kinase
MAYSTKALPAGTVLREWRLEEVLGVGGFGIVYKGRGIYFDELVAIKEYFPSAISERKDGDTVVPIDSEAEEVHALGLKKFVEEAKLLWNLSTPTRHPNIVSVRSLFEIHGTAYMVMDFEDGISLSKLLKQGRRFNEASLMGLMRPIAEGLERAHRVGVLHRDIKPANMLVNEDGRPVLIDFGSARFESGDATSTKVTFHTPPYAAIEQYVKTYDQGPWTDIYALGVVLYECVTGEKPPEVLERMHGGLGSELADREYPGYSRAFLRAIDAAMILKPTERPQSISEWLALCSQPDDQPAPVAEPDDDDQATRFVTFDKLSQEILPVAPTPPGFDKVDRVDTPVPDDVSQAKFQRLGEDTSSGNKDRKADAAVSSPPPTLRAPSASGVAKKGGAKVPLIVGAVLVAVAAGLAGGWYVVKEMLPDVAGGKAGSSMVTPDDNATAAADVVAIDDVADIAPALTTLANDARKAGAPYDAVGALNVPAGSTPDLTAKAASAGFAAMLASDVDRRALRIARELPWADPRRPNAARSEDAARRAIQIRLMQAKSGIAGAAMAARNATDPAHALASARQSLALWKVFAAAQARAFASRASNQTTPDAIAQNETVAEAAPVVESDVGAPVSAGKVGQLAGIVSSGREIADKVIAMGRASRPPSGATKDAKDNYQTLQQNVKSARGYVTYLNTLTNSMRGAKSDRDADRLIAQGEQTKRYLSLLLLRSTAASQ